MSETRQAPGPGVTKLFSLLKSLQRDPIRFFEGQWREHGEVVRIPFAHKQVFLLTNPEHLKHVLRGNYQNYRKADMFNKERITALGHSLLTSEGPHWLKQRKLAQPSFKRDQLTSLVDDMVEIAARDLDEWREHLGGEPFDVAEALTTITINIASKTLFGVDMRPATAKVREAVGVIVQAGAERMATLFRLPLAVPLPSHRRIRRALATLDEVVYGVVRARRAENDPSQLDVLSRLLRARDPETGATMSDEELRDEVTTFLIAGHESTASGLAWTAWLLATHPEIEAKVRAELEAVIGDRRPSAEEIARLDYTRRMVQEALRLYPPSWLFDREAIARDELGGFEIPAGATICILPWLQHRDPAYWPDPERFDPERFLPERVAERSLFSYCPFSGGPRKCIGDEFAYQEMTIVIALMLQRYRLEVVPDHPIELFTLIALRPKHGVQVRLHSTGASEAPTHEANHG